MTNNYFNLLIGVKTSKENIQKFLASINKPNADFKEIESVFVYHEEQITQNFIRSYAGIEITNVYVSDLPPMGVKFQDNEDTTLFFLTEIVKILSYAPNYLTVVVFNGSNILQLNRTTDSIYLIPAEFTPKKSE